MGIFDWITGQKSNVEILDDLIWLTKKVKFERIAESVTQTHAAQDRPVAVILVAHFQDCLNELQTIVESGQFNGSVMAAAVEKLNAASMAQTPFFESQRIDIIVGERHPLASHDEAVVQFARSLTCQCRVVHHLSLEDALLTTFAGDWVKNVLKGLGMKDDQAIQSKLVARRIKDCQRRIQRLASADVSADSAEQWMELNIPESFGNN
ncbi:MAG TPA: hypothetical protein VG055_09320 [Planctomycetaceae bacterium]|jgi:preprotein translocase subunit SecA|nr:hypothetical protein [Planctomycetaceae bacterium]